MSENAAKAKAMQRMKMRHATSEVKRNVRSVPAEVQNMHTKRFMPENALAILSASPIGVNPAEYAETAANAIAQIFGLTH